MTGAPQTVSRRRGRAASRTGTKFGISKDPMRLALVGFVLVSIARIQYMFPFLLPLRPALLTIGIAAGFAFLDPKAVSWRNIFSTWVGTALILYGGSTIVSSFAGISLGGSASYLISDFSRTLVATFIFLAGIKTVQDLWLFLWTYALCLGLWAYNAFFVFQTTNRGSKATRLDDLYTYDANDIGVVILMGVPFLFMLFPSATKKGKLILTGILIGSVGTIALSGSRGGLVGVAALSLFALFTVKEIAVWKRVATLGALVLGLIVFAPPGYWDQMSTILEPEEDYNVTDVDGRWQIIKRGMTYVADYPVFGLGPANFGRAELANEEKRAALGPRAAQRNVAPHNTYLQIITELGLVGFSIWMYILLRGIIGGLRLRKRLPRRWKRGNQEERFLYAAGYFFPLAFVGFAVPSSFVTFGYLSPPLFLFAFWGAYLRLFDDRIRMERRRRHEARQQAFAGQQQLRTRPPASGDSPAGPPLPEPTVLR